MIVFKQAESFWGEYLQTSMRHEKIHCEKVFCEFQFKSQISDQKLFSNSKIGGENTPQICHKNLRFETINFAPVYDQLDLYFLIISRRREILICTMCVRACVGACVSACVCRAVFSKTITVRHFLSKKSPNEFSCPRIFFWFYSF